jgi:adenylate kinase family enzyme
MIIGSGGAGKSTLARRLGEILGLPVVHLDKEFWSPDWTEPPKDEWREKQQKIFSQPEWIADGNYGNSIEMRLEKADTVIFLDINRFVCLISLFKRRVKFFGKTRPDMAKGCPEKMDFVFLKWVWQYPSKTRPQILKKISAHKNLIIIKNRRTLKNFISEIEMKNQ